MAHTRAPSFSAAVLTVASVLIGNTVGCGSQNVTTLYKVGGTVTGLTGTLKLANNGGDMLTLSAAGAFQFSTGLKKGAAYDVSVTEAPTGQTCTVSSGKGTVGTEDISSVVVTCSEAAYTLGGSVAGLTGSLVLANGSATVDVAAGATSFVFAAPLAQGAPYAVTVQTQPTGQRCDITAGSGTVAGANVTSIAVSCAATHAIKVHVTGVNGVNMQVSNNANDSVTVPYDDNAPQSTYDFTFPTGYIAGQDFNVTVSVQPENSSTSDQSAVCTPSPATGTVGGSDVTINIQCIASHTLYVNVVRDGTTTFELSDGVSSTNFFCGANDGCPALQYFSDSYADGSAYHVHLVQGTNCVTCPSSGQTSTSTDISGSFNGDDVYVNYACDSKPCPAVN